MERFPQKTGIAEFFRDLQNSICMSLEQTDGKAKFREDSWLRPEGGGGLSRVIEEGHIFEKGGVNSSEVFGELSEKLRSSLAVNDADFYATGISLVLHPRHPFIPIVHMNLRYFEVGDQHRWFGGGIDLTPHYIKPKEAGEFHQGLKDICDAHSLSYYPDFKKWADDYFFIPHRNETRGVGGIFFDRLRETPDQSLSDIFAFVRELGQAFTALYLPLVDSNKHLPYGIPEKDWQLLRRSRYVEFNLVYDAGTRFGLETNGRIESILMSLPPMASWKYNVVPEAGSAEEKTLGFLKKGINWIV